MKIRWYTLDLVIIESFCTLKKFQKMYKNGKQIAIDLKIIQNF